MNYKSIVKYKQQSKQGKFADTNRACTWDKKREEEEEEEEEKEEEEEEEEEEKEEVILLIPLGKLTLCIWPILFIVNLNYTYQEQWAAAAQRPRINFRSSANALVRGT